MRFIISLVLMPLLIPLSSWSSSFHQAAVASSNLSKTENSQLEQFVADNMPLILSVLNEALDGQVIPKSPQEIVEVAILQNTRMKAGANVVVTANDRNNSTEKISVHSLAFAAYQAMAGHERGRWDCKANPAQNGVLRTWCSGIIWTLAAQLVYFNHADFSDLTNAEIESHFTCHEYGIINSTCSGLHLKDEFKTNMIENYFYKPVGELI